MIDWAAAWQRASAHVAAMQTPDGGGCVLLDDATREFRFGWVFFWNSAAFAASGEFRDSLLGNVPFLVDRADGSLHALATNWRKAAADYDAAWHGPSATGGATPESPGAPTG